MLIVLFALLGLIVGILINRAADNLPPPHRRSLLETPRCPNCDTPRTPVQQIGILSFVLRRDKCPNCSAPVSLRAPLVELSTSLLFAFLASRYGVNLYQILLCLFTAILVLITVIDLEHKLILNVVVIPATILALLASPVIMAGADTPLSELRWDRILFSLLGAAVGYLITYIMYWFGKLFVIFVNRSRKNKITTVAFGFGDVRLGGLLGALIGFPAIFYALIYAILLGGIGAVLAILLRSFRKGGYSAFTAIPYGPYLVLSGWAFFIFSQELFRWIYGG